MFVLEDIVAIGLIGCLVYSIFLVARRLQTRAKRKADAWLAVSRVLLSHNPQEIENVLILHEKYLDKHMKSALQNRKVDLELDIETQEAIQEFIKRNDRQCN